MGLVDTKGIDVIPEEEQARGFWGLFVLWAGFTIVITDFLLGSLTIETGLVLGLTAALLNILGVGVIVYSGTRIVASEWAASTLSSALVAGLLYHVLQRPLNARIGAPTPETEVPSVHHR